MGVIPIDIDHPAAPCMFRDNFAFVFCDLVSPKSHTDFNHLLSMYGDLCFNCGRRPFSFL